LPNIARKERFLRKAIRRHPRRVPQHGKKDEARIRQKGSSVKRQHKEVEREIKKEQKAKGL